VRASTPTPRADSSSAIEAFTLTFDQAGSLYLARTGRRYVGGEAYDLWPIYRIPAGGARLSPDVEGRYFYGPPLLNPQVGATRRGRELFVTTFDRERKVGALYRVVDGRAELFAGGTPERGARPVLRQPEASAVDSAGNLYVADRAEGVIVRLDPEGRLLNPAFVKLARPRLLRSTSAISCGSQRRQRQRPISRARRDRTRLAAGRPRSSTAGLWSPRSASAPEALCSWPIATRSRSSSDTRTASGSNSPASPMATCREASSSLGHAEAQPAWPAIFRHRHQGRHVARERGASHLGPFEDLTRPR
jgi:hypothetical protein